MNNDEEIARLWDLVHDAADYIEQSAYHIVNDGGWSEKILAEYEKFRREIEAS